MECILRYHVDPRPAQNSYPELSAVNPACQPTLRAAQSAPLEQAKQLADEALELTVGV